MDLAPSLTKVGSDVVLIFQRYKQLSLKVCSVVIGTLLLLVLHLIEKSHNANHNNRCKIITTNEIFIVYICLEAISYISLQCEFESRQQWKMTLCKTILLCSSFHCPGPCEHIPGASIHHPMFVIEITIRNF